MKPTLCYRMWLALSMSGPLMAREIGHKLRVPMGRIYQNLYRSKRLGYVTAVPLTGKEFLYSAGIMPQQEGRGKELGSQIVLEREASRKRIKKRAPKLEAYEPATELERCWRKASPAQTGEESIA